MPTAPLPVLTMPTIQLFAALLLAYACLSADAAAAQRIGLIAQPGQEDTASAFRTRLAQRARSSVSVRILTAKSEAPEDLTRARELLAQANAGWARFATRPALESADAAIAAIADSKSLAARDILAEVAMLNGHVRLRSDRAAAAEWYRVAARLATRPLDPAVVRPEVLEAIGETVPIVPLELPADREWTIDGAPAVGIAPVPVGVHVITGRGLEWEPRTTVVRIAEGQLLALALARADDEVIMQRAIDAMSRGGDSALALRLAKLAAVDEVVVINDGQFARWLSGILRDRAENADRALAWYLPSVANKPRQWWRSRWLWAGAAAASAASAGTYWLLQPETATRPVQTGGWQ